MPKSGTSSAKLCLARWCRETWRWQKRRAMPPACWITLPAPAGRGLTSNSAWRYWSVSKDHRRLGRGLAALLGAPLLEGQNTSGAGGASASDSTDAAPHSQAASTLASFAPLPSAISVEKTATENGGLLQLSVDEIEENPFQPRRAFSEAEIASLAESLKEHDMLQ